MAEAFRNGPLTNRQWAQLSKRQRDKYWNKHIQPYDPDWPAARAALWCGILYLIGGVTLAVVAFFAARQALRDLPSVFEEVLR